MKDKFGSIQWVIDALDTDLSAKTFSVDGYWRTDSVRADRDLSWCPICKRKWNING